MALRRGFKSEAEGIAGQVRKELGIEPHQPIAPERIGELLGIEIRAGDKLIPRSKFEELDEIQPGAFSACTLQPTPGRLVVVYNPLSTVERRRSDLAHELAHTLLDHELSRIERLGDLTFLSCDSVQEEEAAWLGGCLLLPRELLMAEVRQGLSETAIAEKHVVSVEMARYRLNVTGVARQHQARRRNAPSRDSG